MFDCIGGKKFFLKKFSNSSNIGLVCRILSAEKEQRPYKVFLLGAMQICIARISYGNLSGWLSVTAGIVRVVSIS